MRPDDVRAFFDSVDAEPSTMFADELLARLRVEYQRGLGPHLEPGQPMVAPVLLELLNDEPPSYVSQPPRPRRAWSRRRRIAIGVAVAASLIVASGVYLRAIDDDGVVVRPVDRGPATTTGPSTPREPLPDGFAWLPPEGSVLSTPETGELVAAVGKIHDGAWFLYADGRLISIDDQDGHGWVEQRLTAAGVERVRSGFLASGLFDPSRQPSEVLSAEELTYDQRALVRDGDKFLIAQDSTSPPDHSLYPCPSDAPGTKCHLIWYLRGLASSLPPDEWTEQQASRYVPARYALCLTGGQFTEAPAVALTDLPSVVALLPSPAPELLQGREPTGDLFEAANSCFALTIVEARALEAAFLDAFPDDVQTFPSANSGSVVTRMQLPSTTVLVKIEFWPLLPAGGLVVWGG
jgi:hypothetical protein